jgi:ArsR family transcriptional regulator, arsenate/arsenite/antimonite-responsive transcriptional repressor
MLGYGRPMSPDPVPSTLPAPTLEACAPAAEGLAAVTPPDDDTLAALAKALGHPARVRILRLLAEREACITRDVVEELPLAQSTVSEHLRILRDAGLIQASAASGRSAYCVAPAGLALLKAGVADL